MKKFSVFLLVAMGMISCVSTNNEEKSEEPSVQEMGDCVYRYNADSTQFTWTGYKFTERVGVSGTFTEIHSSGFTEKASIIDCANGISFKIPVASIESNNPDRNSKIVSFFFNTIETETIYGQVRGFLGEPDSGLAKVMIQMNGIEQVIPMSYTVKNDVLEMDTEINIEAWNGLSGIEKLNEACYDLHKGPDGVSILWPNVRLNIRSKFDLVCP